jgi:hypothetical protein
MQASKELLRPPMVAYVDSALFINGYACCLQLTYDIIDLACRDPANCQRGRKIHALILAEHPIDELCNHLCVIECPRLLKQLCYLAWIHPASYFATGNKVAKLLNRFKNPDIVSDERYFLRW